MGSHHIRGDGTKFSQAMLRILSLYFKSNTDDHV
jgi:hypothetical protein